MPFHDTQKNQNLVCLVCVHPADTYCIALGSSYPSAFQAKRTCAAAPGHLPPRSLRRGAEAAKPAPASASAGAAAAAAAAGHARLKMVMTMMTCANVGCVHVARTQSRGDSAILIFAGRPHFQRHHTSLQNMQRSATTQHQVSSNLVIPSKGTLK